MSDSETTTTTTEGSETAAAAENVNETVDTSAGESAATETTDATVGDTLLTGDTDTTGTEGGEGTTETGTETGTDIGTENTFLDSLPEELRGHERLKDITSVEDLAKAFTEMKAAPEVPESYEFAKGTKPESAEVLSSFAKEAELSQQQLNKVLGFHQHVLKQQEAAFTKTEAEGIKGLQTEWGADFKARSAEAKACLERVDTTGEIRKLLGRQDIRAGNHPAVVKFFYELSTRISEDTFETSGGEGGEKKSFAQVMYPDQ